MHRRRRSPSRRPHPSSPKPTRRPRGPAFRPSPVSRPLPEPSSPDGRQRKKVRFANGSDSHNICGRQDAHIREAEKTKPQVYDGKTSEYKFFKKFLEASGRKFHSCNQSRQSTEPNIPKQKDDMRLESQINMSYGPIQKNALHADQIPVTPSKNEEICDEQSNVRTSHSDTPQLNLHGYLPSIHVLTPRAQMSFEVAGISRNNEPRSGGFFSEKRSKLLKLAAKTMSMESTELLRRRSDFVADILQRLGIKNMMMSMHHKESVKQMKMGQRHTTTDSKGQHEKMLDHGSSEFDSLTKPKISGKVPCPHAGNEACEFMALPWEYNRDLPSCLDRDNNFAHGGSIACESIALPWEYNPDLSSSLDWGNDFLHGGNEAHLVQFPEFHARGKSTSASELSLKLQTGRHGHLEWEPRLSLPPAEPIPNRLPSPHQIEEKSIVPYTKSNAFWQPEHNRSLVQSISCLAELEEKKLKEVELFDNSCTGLLSSVNLSPVKCTTSSILDLPYEILDHHHHGSLSSCPLKGRKGIMSFDAIDNCLNPVPSTSDLPYELGWKSIHDSAICISHLDGLEEKDSKEAEPFDNYGIGLVIGVNRLGVKCTSSSFADLKYGSLDRHCLPIGESNSIVSSDANDCCLYSLPSTSEHRCQVDWNSLQDSAAELWPSGQHLQSHGGNLGAVLDFMTYEGIGSDLEDHCSLMLAQGNRNNDLFGSSDLSFFGSCSTMDSIKEASMLLLDDLR